LSDRGIRVLAGSLVGAALVGLWLGFGVSGSEIARYLAYEIALVLLPGILAYRAISPAPGGALRQIAIGWPLGYAIEIAAFALTAALDLRGLFPLLPLAVAAAAGFYIWRTGPSSTEEQPSGDQGTRGPLPTTGVWVVAGVAIAALIYLSLGFFVSSPLPGDVGSVSYDVDTPFDITVVAEAKHHWPIENPTVAGLPLPYHVYAFIDMAAVSQVTGIEPSTLVLRLFPAPLIVLITLQLVALGREVGRSVWIGPLAAVLVLLTGELDLDPDRPFLMGNPFFDNLFHSPTFLFAIPLFLAITLLLLGALPRRNGMGPRTAALLLVLLLACAGAKASVLPVVSGGLVVWIAWAWLGKRAPIHAAVIALGTLVLAFILTYLLLYQGGGAGGFSLALFGFTDFTVFNELIEPAARSPLGDVALTGLTGPISLAAGVLPALGIIWVIRVRGLRLEPGEAWLLALFLTSLGAFVLLSHERAGEFYFLHYGYIAGCVLSAKGILLFTERFWAHWERSEVALGGLVAGALAGGAVAAAIIHVPASDTACAGRLALGFAVAALTIVALALWASRASRGRVAGAGTGIALLLTISLGLLNTPLDTVPPIAEKLDANLTLYPEDDVTFDRGLTRDLYDGLRWVRDHSDDDEVIAVNNHFKDAAGTSSRYWYYTAFTERRAFLESWIITTDAQEIGYDRVSSGEEVPFPERRRLNAAVFEMGSPSALAELRAGYGVDLLLVDKVHGSASPKLRELARPVFENDALTVYRVGRSNSAHPPEEPALGSR
jgi:hypothetical protein